MIRVMFVCLGNICRSPMAESVAVYLAGKYGLKDKFEFSSSATGCYQTGASPYRGTTDKLKAEGIPVVPHRAVTLTSDAGERFDYVIGMDGKNISAIKNIIGNGGRAKVCRLADFTDCPRDIDDPWYTRDFDAAFNDIYDGVDAMIKRLAHTEVSDE